MIMVDNLMKALPLQNTPPTSRIYLKLALPVQNTPPTFLIYSNVSPSSTKHASHFPYLFQWKPFLHKTHLLISIFIPMKAIPLQTRLIVSVFILMKAIILLNIL